MGVYREEGSTALSHAQSPYLVFASEAIIAPAFECQVNRGRTELAV